MNLTRESINTQTACPNMCFNVIALNGFSDKELIRDVGSERERRVLNFVLIRNNSGEDTFIHKCAKTHLYSNVEFQIFLARRRTPTTREWRRERRWMLALAERKEGRRLRRVRPSKVTGR